MTLRLAMWSGPRNLSTALMYAFANRPDCVAVDEPFYAAYLTATGLIHPMQDAVLASQPADPAAVAQSLLAPLPPGKTLFYQKHMTHHMQPGWPDGWMDSVTHAFLIRHPARVVASYLAKRENPTLADLGFTQQAAIFDRVADRLGHAPPVIDSADIRAAPEPALRALCAALAIPFDPAMLAWPAGPKPCDGAWASHWYGAVHASTGFDAAEGPLPILTGEAARLAEAAQPIHDRLAAVAISPRPGGSAPRSGAGAGR
jgi:hypothetical protein